MFVWSRNASLSTITYITIILVLLKGHSSDRFPKKVVRPCIDVSAH